MRLRVTKWIYFACITAALVACNETKHVQPGQYLYVGSDVKIKSSVEISKKKKNQLSSEPKDLIRPKQNSKFLGIRFKLWFYNIAGSPKGKGFRYLLREKLGEAPVLASLSVFEKNRAVLQNRLENRGYFHDTVKLDTAGKRRKMKGIYT